MRYATKPDKTPEKPTGSITKTMEKVFRCRHHDFNGLSEEETAEATGYSQAYIRELLADMKKIAPQLFPILTPDQAKAWHLWFNEGMTCAEIAEIMDTTESTIQHKLYRVKKKKGFDYNAFVGPREILNFDYIDETKIKQKF